MEQFNTRQALLDTIRELRTEIDQVVASAGEDRATQPGSFEDLSLKDVIAHLTGWRVVTAARLEAGLRHQEPTYPWPDHLQDDDIDTGGVDDINHWFYEQSRDKSLAEVMAESNDTFDRVERAIAAMPDDDLFTPDRFAWL
ncbi:MAG TPA: ClbS/DfsB family four-helix bundle protein, partial [Thermomicrobiales bacterium]|nr:ClbS/DfsB family four-helix bundle protein [Thermomicrobiales bacterium]